MAEISNAGQREALGCGCFTHATDRNFEQATRTGTLACELGDISNVPRG
jgi:hypothetical protein